MQFLAISVVLLCGVLAVAKASIGSGSPVTKPCNITTIYSPEILNQCLGKFVLRDCCDTVMLGRQTGVYWIAATEIIEDRQEGVCDTVTRGGGWLVIARRVSAPAFLDFDAVPSTLFVRGWMEFEEGFGQLSDNFWWGLQGIHQQTNAVETELLMVFRLRSTKVWRHVYYERFHVGGPETNYTLTIDGYSGDVYNSFDYVNGSKFSTWDRDNDNQPGNCLWGLDPRQAGWWTGLSNFPICFTVHPLHTHGIYYDNLQGRGELFDFDMFEMKIRPKHFPSVRVRPRP